jgi:hypothetical protein
MLHPNITIQHYFGTYAFTFETLPILGEGREKRQQLCFRE